MSYTLHKNITTVNRTVMTNKTNRYIVIHYTGNTTDTAKNNAAYFKSVNRNASAHYFVDKTTVYQVVEEKDAAWSVGVNYGSDNLFHTVKNSNSINIEMCSDHGAIADDTFNNTVELTKSLMKKYSIPAANVYRHYDICSKKCPGWTGWVGTDETLWKKFKTAIDSSLTTSTTSELYRVRRTWTDASSQIGAFASLSNAMTACKEGYSVFDNNGNVVYAKASTIDKKTTPSKVLTKVTYTSHRIVDNKWGNEIVGYNTTNSMGYSGVIGKSIDKITIKVNKGTITYMAHRTDGKWGSEITAYSTTDANKYAGSTGKPIDAIALKATGITGTLKYRVHTKSDNKWWGWITGYSKTNSAQYAGVFGKEIDAVQIGIE